MSTTVLPSCCGATCSSIHESATRSYLCAACHERHEMPCTGHRKVPQTQTPLPWRAVYDRAGDVWEVFGADRHLVARVVGEANARFIEGVTRLVADDLEDHA